MAMSQTDRSQPIEKSGLFRPKTQPPFAEFVALVAMMFACIALSIDAMLPALPQIATDLGLSSTNQAQLVITAFVAGMGIGQLIAGPLSDSLGRRAVIAGGIALYIAAALVAGLSQSLTVMLIARFVQGLGVAAPRIAAVAMVRDRYEGRMMARVMSFVMTLFMLVPAAAPFFGQMVIAASGWRAIFVVLGLFGTVAVLWMLIRQPETLAPGQRRPFSFAAILGATRELLGNRLILLYTLAIAVGFGPLFGFISSVQQIYDVSFDRAESFPLWFAAMALIAGSAGPLNAKLVMNLGMRKLATRAFLIQSVISVIMVVAWQAGLLEPVAFGAFFIWSVSVFFLNGLIFGNLNALALEPAGHIAGMAASIVGAVSTILAVVIAIPIGLAFDGTPVPLIIGITVCSCLGYAIMVYAQSKR